MIKKNKKLKKSLNISFLKKIMSQKFIDLLNVIYL